MGISLLFLLHIRNFPNESRFQLLHSLLKIRGRGYGKRVITFLIMVIYRKFYLPVFLPFLAR